MTNEACSNPYTATHVSDTDRLEWAMYNMQYQEVFVEFAWEVLKRGGQGDLGDIRHFIDMKMSQQTP